MMEIDDLLPNIEGITLLNFAKISEGDIFITDLGRRFVEADTDESKEIFGEQLHNISTFQLINNVLKTKKNKTMRREFFMEIFNKYFPQDEVEHLMDIIIDWGRYAELFSYDDDSEELFIESES